MKINTKMIAGYYIEMFKEKHKGKQGSLGYKPNANRITTTHRPSLTQAIDKKEKKNNKA